MDWKTALGYWSPWRTIIVEEPTAVEEDAMSVEGFELKGSFPNPFHTVTSIHFFLPHRSPVTIQVVNALGQVVATLVHGVVDAGEHSVVFAAHNLPSGVYACRMVAGAFFSVQKLVLIRE